MMYVLAAVVTLIAVAAWLLSLAGLPGSWIIVILGGLLALFAPAGWIIDTPWLAVGVLVGLALLGELIEFVASGLGVQRVGGSKKAIRAAVIGSILGALVGMPLGAFIPIPLLGSLIGAVLCSGAGAALGAYWAERQTGTDSRRSARIGVAALFGRIMGTFGKAICALVMAIYLILHCWW
jgi:uncharacterized protein YqgC (DUF456 family)